MVFHDHYFDRFDQPVTNPHDGNGIETDKGHRGLAYANHGSRDEEMRSRHGTNEGRGAKVPRHDIG